MLLGPWQGLGNASKLKLGFRYTNGALPTMRSPAPRHFWQKTGVRAEYHSGQGNGSDGDGPEGTGEARPANGVRENNIILRTRFTTYAKLDTKWLSALQKSLFHAVIDRSGKKALRGELNEILLEHLCKAYIAFILRTHAGIKMARQEREALRGVVDGTKVELFNDLVWLIRFVELMVYQKEHGGLPVLSHPDFGNWVRDQRHMYNLWLSGRKAKWRIAPWRMVLLGTLPECQWSGPSQPSEQPQPVNINKEN